MVKQCVNSSCREEFKLLNGGDLYALERRTANTEFFWLCPACAREYELYLDPTGTVSVRGGSRHPSRATAASRRQSAAHLPHDEAAARHDALRRTSI